MPQAHNGLVSSVRKHWQIIYAVFLIALVPSLIVLNTVYAVSAYRNNIDAGLQRQALVVGRMFNLAAVTDLAKDSALQSLVNDSAKQVEELHALDVLVPTGTQTEHTAFRIAASLDPQAVGHTSTQVQNVLAWGQNDAFAFLTSAPATSSDDASAIMASDPNIRYWAVVMPLKDASGRKQALLFMKFSLTQADTLVRDTLLRSYLWLAIIVLIAVLVLASNTRLFQYAMLFRRLKEVDEMKDEFIGMASHELRTPITAIKGFVELILEDTFGKVTGEVRENVGTVGDLTDRLNDLVVDLLDVSRIEQGRLGIEPVPLQIEELVRETVHELEPTARAKGLPMTFQEPSALLPMIEADPKRIRQILMNIIGNAIKYTPTGSITVTAFTSGDSVRVKCTDTGIGMAPEEREHLFEKFYRIRTKKTSDIPGTGLGLWITKQLVELQKGRIIIDSIEGVGTQVTVAFPPVKRQ